MLFGWFKPKPAEEMTFYEAHNKAQATANLEKALPYYLRAIWFDPPDGSVEYELAERYWKLSFANDRPTRYLQDALHWYEVAGEKGHLAAQERCIHIHWRYLKNEKQVYYWLKKADRTENYTLQSDRIHFLLNGRGGPADPDEAFFYCARLTHELHTRLEENSSGYSSSSKEYLEGHLRGLTGTLSQVYLKLPPQHRVKLFYSEEFGRLAGAKLLLVAHLMILADEGNEAAKQAVQGLPPAG